MPHFGSFEDGMVRNFFQQRLQRVVGDHLDVGDHFAQMDRVVRLEPLREEHLERAESTERRQNCLK